MSDTPRTDSCYQQILDEGLGLEYAEDELREWSKKLERELAAAIASFSEERERAQREGARVIELQVKLAEAQEELNDKRNFCYAVEQALDGLKGDYVEIIKELRKDAERYRWIRDEAEWYSCHIKNTVQFKTGANFLSLDAAIDAAMKEGK
jgi:hypothetical protein